MDILEERKLIQVEETKPQAAISESLMTRVGAGINFINKRHLYQHDWHLNGKYNIITPPNFGLDGFITYPFPFQLMDVQVFAGENVGISGFTELDVQWTPDNVAPAYQSIFDITPKFDSTVNPFETIRIGQTKSGWTAPVLNKTLFDAYDILKLDLLNAVDGEPNGVFVKLFILPR
jgi:hypothetical protein